MSSIDYDLRKIKAIALDVDGVLSPTVIPLSENGEPLRMINIKDGYAIQLAIKKGYKIAIITGGLMPSVQIRFMSLGVQDIYMGISEKLPILYTWMQKYQLNPDEVAYMGDDIPDIPAMQKVGLSCCPNDSTNDVKNESQWISRYIGGYGCVRDLIEQIMKAKGDWLNNADAFKW